MTKKLCPPLGFPDEEWDEDGDYYCRPLPEIIAAVIVMDNGAHWVSLAKYRGNEPLMRAWLYTNNLNGEIECECPLHAQGAIFHLIATYTESLKNG